jgi:asparagine synthase (glutamine-hydrolysing)
MNPLAGVLHPDPVLRAAAQSLLAAANDSFVSRGALLLSASAPLALAEAQGLGVVIVGNPRWRDPQRAAEARTHGHAAALLAAWQAEGMEALHALEGSFALAVHVAATDDLHLAVDPIGIEPLAYAECGAGLAFASRADGLARLQQANIDPQGIFDYVYCHMVPSPGTVWRGVRKLGPGEHLHFRNGHSTIRRWWSPPWREPVQANQAEQRQRLLETLLDATASSLGDSTAAAFLSGGLDSSTVVAMLSRLRGSEVDCFGIGFNAEGYDEMAYARASAKHAGARLHEYYVTPEDVLQALPLVAAAYDEPFGNASAVPAYFCARKAAEHGFTLMLAGDGGDELFGGNARYARQLWFEPYTALPGVLRQGLEALFIDTPLARVPGFAKAASFLRQARTPLPDRLENWNFLHRTALASVFTADFLAQVNPEQPLAGMRARYAEAGQSSVIKRMLHLDLKFTLADNDLRKVNRMAEVAGMKVHYPLLELPVVDFAAGLPSDWLVHKGELRWFYRRCMQGVLAEQTLSKHKHGFGLPFGLWMRSHAGLRDLAETRLRELRSRGWFNPDWIDLLLVQHAGPHADYYGVMIWVLTLLEEWLQQQSISRNQP